MTEDLSESEVLYLRKEIIRLRKALNILTPSLEMLLKRRGFQVYKKEPSEDLLIPDTNFIDAYYSMLHKYSYRLFLRDVIKHQSFFSLENVVRYSTPQVTAEYLDFLQQIGLAVRVAGGYRLAKLPVKSFGETLEWYLAEIFSREFCSEAFWGVKFKRPNIGGDYDVIAKFDGSLLYVEAKSSPPKQVHESEIAAFFDRIADLLPEVAVFFMDTELRMKDKIVPMFEIELAKRFAVPPGVYRIEKELFQMEHRIFIINAKDSIIRNVEKVLNCYFRR